MNRMHLKHQKLLVSILMLVILGYALSCTKEEFHELPSLVMDDPINELDSIQITARINLKEVNGSRITEAGFHWARVGDLNMTKVIPLEPIPDNANTTEFKGVWTGLALDEDYYFQAYIRVEGSGLIHSEIDTTSTRDIVLSTSFSATGDRVNATERVQLFGRLSGLRDGVTVEAVGHLWIVEDAALPRDQWDNFDIASADSIRSFAPPSGGRSFDFGDVVWLDPSRYYYIRPFAAYNGVPQYGEAVEIFIGNFWKRTGALPRSLTNTVNFVIDDKAYIVTGAFGINSGTFQFDTSKLYNGVVICDPTHPDPAQRFIEDTEPFPGLPRVDAVAFTLNGKGYVGTGRRDTVILNDFWSYDPSKPTDKWQSVDSIPLHVYDAISFVVQGKAYVGTGNRGTSNDGDFNPTSEMSVFDGMSWQDGLFFENNIANAVSWTVNGIPYVATGHIKSFLNPMLSDIYMFDAGSLSFVSQENYAGAPRQSAVAFTVDSRAYVGVGSNQIGGLDPAFHDFFVFDVESSIVAWRGISNFGFPNELYCASTAFGLHGKGYVCGGLGKSTGSVRVQDGVWEYTPSPKN